MSIQVSSPDQVLAPTWASSSILERSLILSTLAVLGGGMLLSYVNGGFSPLILSFLLVPIGLAISSIPGLSSPYGVRALLLTYGNCCLVAGLCQLLAYELRGNPVDTIDAANFLKMLPEAPPFRSFAEFGFMTKASLATYVWQQWERFCWELGFSHGPYIGVLLNALIVGLAASLTVSCAREVYGTDALRLRRVGTTFALCGHLLMFGSLLIRDCFVVFVNVAALWGLIHLLKRPSLQRLVLCGLVIALAVLAMNYLRYHAVYLFGALAVIAFVCWFWERRGTLVRLAILTTLFLANVIAYPYVERYVEATQEQFSERTESYLGFSKAQSSTESLGMRFVTAQPLPIRIVLGSFVLLAFPLPIWGQVTRYDLEGYFVLETYEGLFKLYLVPLVLAGLILGYREVRKNPERGGPMLFLMLYAIMGVLMVAATSREGRHLGQFLPGMLIVAALPLRADGANRRLVQRAAILWVASIVLAHLAWGYLAL